MNSILASRIPAFVVRPAGQVANADMSFSVNPTTGAYSSGQQYWDAQGNPISGPPAPIPMPPPPGGSLFGSTSDYGNPNVSSSMTGKDVPDVATSTAAEGMSQADQTALFDDVASGLNTAGATIAAIINSGNQLQIAQLQSQTQTQIAALNQQAQQAQLAGNMALAQQNAQRAGQLAQFQQAFLMQRTSNTGLYIVAGAVVLGIIGTFVYLGSSTRK